MYKFYYIYYLITIYLNPYLFTAELTVRVTLASCISNLLQHMNIAPLFSSTFGAHLSSCMQQSLQETRLAPVTSPILAVGFGS